MKRLIALCLLLGSCTTYQTQTVIDASLFHPLNTPNVVVETWRCQLGFDDMLETEKLNCGLLGISAALPVKERSGLRGFMRRVLAHDKALPGIFPDDFEIHSN